jgi:hypothetical protein
MSYVTLAPSSLSSSPPIDDTPWLVLIYGTVAGGVILCGFCFLVLCNSCAVISQRSQDGGVAREAVAVTGGLRDALIPVEDLYPDSGRPGGGASSPLLRAVPVVADMPELIKFLMQYLQNSRRKVEDNAIEESHMQP